MRYFLCIAIMAASLFWPLIGSSQTFDPRSTKGLSSCNDYPAMKGFRAVEAADWAEKVSAILPGPNHACWFHAANGSGGYVLSPQSVLRAN
jgi:hypothetical protein